MPYGKNDMIFENNPHEAMSLAELNYVIKETILNTLPGRFWVCAEMSDVRVNASSGHCYLEFIDKDELSGQVTAKARGTIWARAFQIIKPYFEQETGQTFISGLKVLVSVSVEFHEVYGYSLSVHDIDPSYTLGDIARRKKEIIRQLQEDGIFDLNRELPFPVLPQRIAVITSPTAAGYEDFTDQLAGNEYGFSFYVKLFPAIMQGEKTEGSVIAALDRIFPYVDLFDAVVIIRGGGSTSELSSFDSYSLAANCAQFPLPVITGIGHERDDTVVDMVAHTRMKTPTAVASFLIECMVKEVGRLHEMTTSLSALPQWIRHRAEMLDALPTRIQRAANAMTSTRHATLEGVPSRLLRASVNICTKSRQAIELNEQYIKMVSPEYILKRGYTLTFRDGKIVKHAGDLSAGDEISVKFADGEKKGRII